MYNCNLPKGTVSLSVYILVLIPIKPSSQDSAEKELQLSLRFITSTRVQFTVVTALRFFVTCCN